MRMKMKMIAIAAVDDNWAIGKDNDLLFSIPEDMEFFRNTTAGHTVLMGRRTLESLPGGKPMPNRTNIVLTAKPDYQAEGVRIVHSVEELLEAVRDLPEGEVFVIGGGSVYKTLLPYCGVCLITKMYRAFEADTYFPDLDKDPEWKITKSSGRKSYGDLDYEFLTYERVLER